MHAACGILDPRNLAVAYFAEHHSVGECDLVQGFVRSFAENFNCRETGSVFGLIDTLQVARREAGPDRVASTDRFKFLEQILGTGQNCGARINLCDRAYRRDGRTAWRGILRRRMNSEKRPKNSRGGEGHEPAVHNFLQHTTHVRMNLSLSMNWLLRKGRLIAVQGGGKETVRKGRSAKVGHSCPQGLVWQSESCSAVIALRLSFWSPAHAIGDRIRACFRR